MKVGIAPIFQNTRDFDRFEASERGEDAGPPVYPDAAIMAESLALCDLAEPLGYDALWTFEHHTSPYIMTPNPQQLIAYMAGRTKRIDFGTMVTVVPWHNPVRLAENVSLLTHMLGPDRRLILGFGRGLALREFVSLGVDMEQSRALMAEGLEVLRLALGQDHFSYHGKVYDFPNSAVRPRPLSTTMVDNAYGVWNSTESMTAAARAGLNPLTIPSKGLNDYIEDLASFDAVRAEHGYGPSQRPILQMFMSCDKSSAAAQERAEQHFTEYAESVGRHYQFGGDHFNKMTGYESYRPGGVSRLGEGGKTGSEVAKATAARIIREGLVGTPAQCIEKAQALQDTFDPHMIVLNSAPGTMPHDAAVNELRLFAEEALPTIQHLTTHHTTTTTP